ncbi:MAG: hypothetical protein HOP31_09830 [Ignavibacteria bacterium]|nr:hypothetical protein [Ignavibacteria bacterium]
MKTLNIFFILVLFNFLNGYSCSQVNKSNSDMGGWFLAGSKPKYYEIGPAMKKYNSKEVYYLKSIENVESGFGTIMKQVPPGEYLGKRVRLTGNIKSENIVSVAGMWMRVDGKQPGVMLTFDNMSSRPIKGTTDWQKYEIVLDVPDSSSNIAYGVLLEGSGSVWLSDLVFEIVGSDVASTNTLVQPVNMMGNFSILPDELINIPDAIEVRHTPIMPYAVKPMDDTANYYWFYKTIVKATFEDLEITEFGAYIWNGTKWVFSNVTGKPFEPKDFAEWYTCKNWKMKKGVEYIDPNNWNYSPILQNGKSLWYYIGRNKKGELFKGTAIVDYVGEMKK